MGKASNKKKAGREFEELITRIESSRLPAGAIVTSPDKIKDRGSGSFREVDASIRYTLGTIPILVTIECRDRSRAAEPRWIDEIIAKKSDIGASASIGVSAKGFSKPARNKAKAHGILLREINELTVEDILDFRPEVAKLKVHIETVNVHYGSSSGEGTILCLDGTPFETDKPSILNTKSGTEASLDEFFHFLTSYATVSWPSYSEVQKALLIRFPSVDVYQVCTNEGMSPLKSLEVTFTGGMTKHALHLEKAFNYVADDQQRLMQFQNWAGTVNYRDEEIAIDFEVLLK